MAHSLGATLVIEIGFEICTSVRAEANSEFGKGRRKGALGGGGGGGVGGGGGGGGGAGRVGGGGGGGVGPVPLDGI